MSKLDEIVGGIYDHKIDHLPQTAKQQIKDLIKEICEECDASPAYKAIVEAL